MSEQPRPQPGNQTPSPKDRPNTVAQTLPPFSGGAAEEEHIPPAGTSALPDLSGLPRLEGFEICLELGRRGMGGVYLARQEHLNRPVALKMILAGDYAGEEALARFLAEAEIIARLQHPYIVQVHAFGTAPGGSPYFALEYLPGGSLHEKLAGTPMAPREAARL